MHNFALIEQQDIEQRRVVAKLFRHDCGMEVLSLECNDIENVFAIGFSTVPEDNTGVPHIIEHSVLCGSRRYPVKEPFTEMLKGSLATYINAFTTQEYTAYPIATTIPKDYFNLATVYFDAVFSPLMSRNAFMQEGWHFELGRPGHLASPLKYNGIVLNEMKGDMNDIDSVIMREVNNALYRETPRHYSSGGYPPDIPKLTYAKYRKFYREHYHPSLAKVYLYGNIPTEEKLAFLEKELETLMPLPTAPKARGPRKVRREWVAPKKKVVKYVPEVSQSMKKGAWAQAYCINNEYDTLLDASFEFLEALLQGNPSTTFARAIMDSKLCESSCISGYDDETMETSYLIALNGVEIKNFGKLTNLIDGMFRKLAEKGFSQAEIEGALTRFKRQSAESNDASVLPIMEDVFDAWCFGLSPFRFLNKKANLELLENKLKEDPTWLKSLISKYFCDNKQKVTLYLVPDAKLEKELAAAETAKLEKLRKSMTKGELKRIDDIASQLKREQEKPNSPEALATLPRLEKSDFPKINPCVKTSVSKLKNGASFIDVDMPSNGLSYLAMALPISALSSNILDSFYLYKRLFGQVGSKALPWNKTIEQLEAHGARYSMAIASQRIDNARHDACGYIYVNLNVLDSHFAAELEAFKEKWHYTVFTEKQRMENLMKSIWANIRGNLSNNSAQLAETRAKSGVTPAAAFLERMNGLPFFKKYQHIRENFNKEFPSLVDEMSQITDAVSSTAPAVFSYLGPESNRTAAMEFAMSFGKASKSFACDFDANGISTGRREALFIPAPVSGCARAMRAPYYWEDGSAELGVFAGMLSNGYLWDEIRVKNGAYGVHSQHLNGRGILTLCSSQDPSPKHTMQVFDNIPQIVMDCPEKELSDAIMYTLKGLLVPTRQRNAAVYAMTDFIVNRTDAFYQKVASQYLSITPDSLKQAVSAYFASNPEKNDCVIGPEKAVAPLNMKPLEFES